MRFVLTTREVRQVTGLPLLLAEASERILRSVDIREPKESPRPLRFVEKYERQP